MLEFETSTGNTYAWIDDIGIYIPTNPILSAILKETSNQNQALKTDIIQKLKGTFDEKEIEYYYGWTRKYEGIKEMLKGKLECTINQNHNESILRKAILKNGITQLILDVTEDCNFRCGYCTFSGNYVHYRNHSKKYMKFDIAKKAIDYYFSLIAEGKRYNPLRQPVVSFYGGEPLLNFKLIKKCIEYIEGTYASHKARYNFTTNGSLLDKEKTDWLMKRDCHILITICGPKEEHDRLRVYKDGKGTFEDIMENIRPLMKEYHNKLGSIAIFDLKTDLFKLDEFFNRQDIPKLILSSSVAKVEGCKYFEQFSETDELIFNKQSLWARKCYMNNLKNRETSTRSSFFDVTFGDSFAAIITDPASLTLNDPITQYSGACLPGKKLLVDVDGDFHICERLNRNFSIGNVEKGLDFGKIGKILEDYIQCLNKCPACSMKRMCERCYVNLSAGKEFMYTSHSCQNQELHKTRLLANAFTLAETNPKIIEKSLGVNR